MADPNDPWAAFSPQPPPQSATFGGRPVIQQMPTPQDQAQLVHTQQQIEAQPLQNANTQVNIEQGKNAIVNTAFQHRDTLRTEFQSLPLVKNYNTVSQKIGTALTAPDNAQGDLAVLYAFATVMDPNSVVRESEQEMAKSTGSTVAQLQQKYNMLTEGSRLPPGVRDGLLETMRKNYKFLNSTYDQTRGQYADLAKRNGFDPNEIVGPSAAEIVQGPEADYIRAHGGTPKINGVPIDQPQAPPAQAPTQAQAGFDGELPRQDPQRPYAEEFRNGLYGAMHSGQIKSPATMQAWVRQFNQQNGTQFQPQIGNRETMLAIRAAQQGKAFNVELPKYAPNISDVRGQQQSIPQQAVAGIANALSPAMAITDAVTGQSGGGDVQQAAMRGVTDTPTFGLGDKIGAAVDTIGRGGTYDENLARQYAISDYDARHHPIARIAGQIAGGAAIPMGEMTTLPQIVGKSAAVGAAYETGSSRSLADVPQNAFLGAAGGAAVGGAVGSAARGLAAVRATPREVPPLVDPVTGELNQPMDTMRPAQRVQTMQNYGLNTVTPGMAGGRTARVLEQGLNNVPGSAGVMEDVNAVAAKELRRSMQTEAQKFGSSKTLNEGGSELQRGANEWMTRFDQTTSKAYNVIPIAGQAKAATSNTVGALQQLTSRVSNNPELAQEIGDPVLQRYLGAIQKGGLDWQGMKEFRTFIGNKIGQFRFSEDARTGDYRALYAALSEDMRDTAANAGPGALRAFERANSIKAQGEQRIETALTSILGPGAKGSPEKAAAAVQAMTKGGKGTGDLAKLAQVRASTIKSGAWDEIASTLIHLGGQPANSEGRAFNPQTFVNWYADMSESARRMLFKPELRQSLDGFVAMTQQLGRVKGLTNTSNTTPTMIGSGVVSGAGLAAAFGHPLAIAGIAGGGAANFGMAKLWTSPAFVKLITGYGRAAASGNANAINSQLGRLSKLAVTNPELRQPIESLLRSLNDNAPQVGQMAASPDQGPGNSAQPQ